MSTPYFYFVAQTGCITSGPPSVSNFHVYKLLGSKLAKVTLAVERATVGPGCLEYPQDFLSWLSQHDLNSREPGVPR